MKCLPFTFFALTNVHPGAPGGGIEVADLPVYRDRFSTVKIRGESLKGAFRSTVSRNLRELEEPLFGGREHAGVFSILDAVLVFVPVTIAEHGLVYLTSPHLLNHFAMHLALGNAEQAVHVSRIASSLSGMPSAKAFSTMEDEKLTVLGEFTFTNTYADWLEPLSTALLDVQQRVLGGDPPVSINHLVVVNDVVASLLLEKAMFLKPGVKLKGFGGSGDRYLKNVEHGPWFEEEIPKFSVFSSAFIVSQRSVEVSVERDEATSFLKESLTKLKEATVTMGGKKLEARIGGEALERILEEYFFNRPLIVGGRETMARGVLKPAKLRFNGGWPEIRAEEESHVGDVAVRRGDELFIDLLHKLEGKIREKADEMRGKFSSLPERVRRLPLTTLHMFYTKVKAESSGKGYEEVREALNETKEKEYFSEEWLCGEELAETGQEYMEKLLQGYRGVVEAFTKLKYVVESYSKKEGEE